ncbi:transcriptional accessory protein [Actinomyces procaprae]|uniref:transcriptional accessory protein n=1 Tax=Actinomyces procaprae TaxID=2560010 RepID=UPI0010A22AC0|nr:transcriptional accessory protein [Actinomyces procaprae]
MIVWSGGGVLAALFLVLGGGGGAAVAAAFSEEESVTMLCMGIGFLIFGVVGRFVGLRINVTRPDDRLENHLRAYEQEMYGRIQVGAFQAAPGVPAPRSAGEAQQQVDRLVSQERDRIGRALRNRHTMFWIPVQYWGFIEAAGGAALLVAALIRVLFG